MTAKPDRWVVLKGNQFARPTFDGWCKRLSEAGLFSKAEAEDFVEGKKGDGWSCQPLEFYRQFLLAEREAIDEKLEHLGVTR